MKSVKSKKKDQGKPGKKDPGLFKGVMLAYLILILHVILAAAIGMLIIFFHGIVTYMAWILFFGFALIFGSGYYFYRRLKAQGRSLRETLDSPDLRGKSFEISMFGGMVSFKVGNGMPDPARALPAPNSPLQLEDPEAARLRELTELSRLLEKNLITQDEFSRIKHDLFKF
jgi:hypothetical protein